MKTLIKKSLLTSLYQREEIYPSVPHTGDSPRRRQRGVREDFYSKNSSILCIGVQIFVIPAFAGIQKKENLLLAGSGFKPEPVNLNL